jgi:hypothetical protein
VGLPVGMDAADHGAAANGAASRPSAELDEHGVCVRRGACATRLCEPCLADVLRRVDPAFPVYGGRHFLPLASTTEEEERQRQFVLSPCVHALLLSLLSGDVGAIIEDALSADAELCEVSAIVSEPGAAAQVRTLPGRWLVAPKLAWAAAAHPGRGTGRDVYRLDVPWLGLT